ncbi:MAG: DNA recombination protein RecO [Rhodospirillaceae bacterium BRH_c57]|nr:MAG: DNA recombination protein RecO [Rhodospirillaceae bacterium BRH_c57]
MEWRDAGIVLGARQHGESSLIVTLLTSAHGRHAGLVKGGMSKAARGLYQPGNLLTVTWRARLEDQLGLYACELAEANAAALLSHPGRLGALTAACAVAEAALPERQSHPLLFDATVALLAALRDAPEPGYGAAYVEWEAVLLQDLGFGLDLSACAVTGSTDDLAWVSPKTGRAVSTEGAGPWREKLLALPAFLLGAEEGPEPDATAIAQGLRLTGWFLDRHALAAQDRRLPPARVRFAQRWTEHIPPS